MARGSLPKTAMRWNILVRCAAGSGATDTVELCQLIRDAAQTSAELGLQHGKTKALLLRRQRRMVRRQAADFCDSVGRSEPRRSERKLKDCRPHTLPSSAVSSLRSATPAVRCTATKGRSADSQIIDTPPAILVVAWLRQICSASGHPRLRPAG